MAVLDVVGADEIARRGRRRYARGNAPPPKGNPAFQLATLARYSAERYGRDALDVELDLQSALERIRGPRRSTEDADDTSVQTTATPNDGLAAPHGVVTGSEVPNA